MSYLSDEEIAKWRRHNRQRRIFEGVLNGGANLAMGVLMALVSLAALAIGVGLALT